MKFKKRKIKYAAIFFVCWFVFLVFLIDGVLKFQTLVDYFGSYALVEVNIVAIGYPSYVSNLQVYKRT